VAAPSSLTCRRPRVMVPVNPDPSAQLPAFSSLSLGHGAAEGRRPQEPYSFSRPGTTSPSPVFDGTRQVTAAPTVTAGAAERHGILHTVAATVWFGPRDPVVSILLLASIFDGLSGNPVDALLLFAAGAALGRERASREGREVGPSRMAAHEEASPRPGPRGLITVGRLPLLTPILLAGALIYGVIVGGFERFSWPMTLAVAGPGALALAVAWRGSLGPQRELPTADSGGAGPWGLAFAAFGLWEFTNLILQPSWSIGSYDHPTLSLLSDPLLSVHSGRSTGLFLWLALGWYLAKR
jgi:hypothetical protein